MSPTTVFSQRGSPCTSVASGAWWGGGVPGVWDDWGAGEGYTGYPPVHHPRVPYSVYLRLEPYLRPNEGYFQVSDEVSQIGSKNGSRMGPE